MTFTNPVIVLDDIAGSDKPWITVDNASGPGQHDVYLTFAKLIYHYPFQLVLTVATNGDFNNWTNRVLIRESTNAILSAIPVLGPDHVAHVFWYENEGGNPGTNWLKVCKVEQRGTLIGEPLAVVQLATTNSGANLQLLRSNTASTDDWFSAFPFPVPAANPVKTNHLYVAFADKGTNENDKADVFFIRSSNGGTTWTNLIRVNTDATTNDQWMPVLAVKPDGTQLFMAWYNRRNDTNNSLMDLYGRFGTIATDGSVAFATNDFCITTTNFPPVFAGTNSDNTADGHYDPVYPPRRRQSELVVSRMANQSSVL